MTLVTQAWLYVRGDESIRVTRLPTGVTLLVFGPRSAEHSHQFDSEPTLNEFWRWYEEHLLAGGWVLHERVERRSAGERAGSAADRRAPGAPGARPDGGPDRRRRAPAESGGGEPS